MGDTALHLLLPRIKNEELECVKYANFLIALTARKKKIASLFHLPVEMTMDISTICQLHCPYCDVGTGRIHRRHQFIALPDFERYAALFGPGCFVFWLFSAGEPLLHPKAAEAVRSLQPYEGFPIVSTNLNIPFTSAKADALLLSGLGMLSVSLDGASQETYVRYRVGGSYARVLENLELLVQRKKALGIELPFIEWRFLLFQHNQHEMEAAQSLAKHIGVDILEFSPGFAPDRPPPEGGDVVLHHTLSIRPDTFSVGPACERGILRRDSSLRRIMAAMEGKPISSVPPIPDSGCKSCDWLYLSGMLYPDGALAPCCVLVDEEDDFGHLDNGSFSRAWNNQKYVETRSALAEGRSPSTACARCPFPAARDYQFHQRIRAAIHNAPDWVLRLMARQMDAFFLPFDRDVLFPRELSCLQSPILRTDGEEDREMARTLRRLSFLWPAFGACCEAVADLLDMRGATQ